MNSSVVQIRESTSMSTVSYINFLILLNLIYCNLVQFEEQEPSNSIISIYIFRLKKFGE